MRWIIKATIQKAISCFPDSEKANYFFRRYIVKSLPLNDDTFFQTIDIARRHYYNFIKYNASNDMSFANFYEFGTGWDLISPLLYYSLGVNRQTLVDIKPNIVPALINNTLQRFSMYRNRIEQDVKVALIKTQYLKPIKNINDLNKMFGITYLAPCDAGKTNLPAESFDFISCTATLEHIPKEDVRRILKECFRLLKPGNIMSALVDLKDHFSYFDNKISIYNFLKFSEKKWTLFNSPLHFQNRLRYHDYLKMIKQSGFEVIAQEVERPDATDIKCLKSIKLAEHFNGGYEDIGVKTLWIVLKKPTI
jgi:ubiquinone/menaquinone biosynthesis C-methylase UbiE